MNKTKTALFAVASGSLMVGCSGLQPKVDVEKLPVTAAGADAEYVIDNLNAGFYTDGEWKESSVSRGYVGTNYLAGAAGSGDKTATWNLNIVKRFDVFARWTSHSNRGSDVKYVVHHLDEQDFLTTTTVVVDQRELGGEWFRLGTFRMSTLTGRVTVSDNADGYVIADAVMFKEVEGTASADADSDGMLDAWELEHGLDPTNSMDADLDPDQDGLTNLQESVALTDPLDPDTDSDRLPDGYEVTAGFDPTVSDSDQDADGDGYTNYQEYLAGTDPAAVGSVLPDNSVLVMWEAPTTRMDGTELSPEEIDYFELKFTKVQSAADAGDDLVVDDESSGFVVYGGNVVSSTSTSGYLGEHYSVLPAGSGESVVSWNLDNLGAGNPHRLSAMWTSHPNRATNAEYRVEYLDENGQLTERGFPVDQTSGGGQWQELGVFTPHSAQVSVSLSNDADGYVIADGLKLEPQPEDTVESVRVESAGEPAYVIDGLTAGEWSIQIRAVDTNGQASEFSAPQTATID